jgi:hypothetical protein
MMQTSHFDQVHVQQGEVVLSSTFMRMQMIRHAGFSAHEAHVVYHEHVAPMNEYQRLLFYSKLVTGVVSANNSNGKKLLATSRGL